MAAGARGLTDIKLNQAALDALLTGPNGPTARLMQRCGELVAQEQKRLAPVSPDGSHGRGSGYMRSKVGWEIGADNAGLFVDIGTSARSPEGFPYPLAVEFGSRPHVIRSKGPWPLRNSRTGQVFGRVVQHPGTRPQPFMRPSLDVLRSGL